MIPITGRSTCVLISLISSGVFARIPDAPPCFAASAILPMMKEECKKEMENIRNTINRVTTLKYRMALCYRYVDGLTEYDIVDIMGMALRTIQRYEYEGIAELANILE